MKDYKVASKLEDELKDALSLGNKASTTLKATINLKTIQQLI